MKIGVDLDNTIVNYERAFLASAAHLKIYLPFSVNTKSKIRDYISSRSEGEVVWQKLQGLAYGKFAVTHAEIYPGVKRFLWRCRERGHKVVIASHKTNYGHQDTEKIPLRKVALDLLLKMGITVEEEQFVDSVTFHDTYEDKISFIENQCFDWFIDDLIEVIKDLQDVSQLKTIHFSQDLNQKIYKLTDGQVGITLSNWQHIDSVINGEWSHSELNQIAFELVRCKITNIQKLSNGGNGGVFRASLTDGRNVKLKIYPIDPHHDRIFSEILVSKALSLSDPKYISAMIVSDRDLDIGVFDWIEGTIVTYVEEIDLQATLTFLKTLDALKKSNLFLNAPLASAACFSGLDIENQINNRIAQFNLPRIQYPELESFFNKSFFPTAKNLIHWSRENWPKQDGYFNSLSKSEWCLSPSDFGFHNAIRLENGSLVFTDFEYFGWDDPVKLMLDFIYHPGMSLSDEQKNYWLKRALNIYGEHHFERMSVFRPLYGLIWCLILLNDFRSDVWERRISANESKRIEKNTILSNQLDKAQKLIAELRLNYSKEFQMENHT